MSGVDFPDCPLSSAMVVGNELANIPQPLTVITPPDLDERLRLLEEDTVAAGGVGGGGSISDEVELEPRHVIPSSLNFTFDFSLDVGSGDYGSPVQEISSVVTQANIRRVRSDCGWSDFEVGIPAPDSRVCDWVEGFSFVFVYPFLLGFSLPISGVVEEFCRAYRVCLAQISPGMWRIVQCLEYLARLARVDFTLGHLLCLFRPVLRKGGMVFLVERGSSPLLNVDDGVSEHDWDKHFVLLPSRLLSSGLNFPERWNMAREFFFPFLVFVFFGVLPLVLTFSGNSFQPKQFP